MEPRADFIKALKREQVKGRVPHFELVFFLTMEVFGRVHPMHRVYSQWDQMKEAERELHRRDMADLYIKIAEKYGHGAILLQENPARTEEVIRVANLIREMSGNKYFIGTHGDSTFGLPHGDTMLEFTYRMADEPGKLKAEAERKANEMLARAERFRKEKAGLDGFFMCCDYCLNTGPFMSPSQFSEFVTPYLKKLVDGYRSMGYYSIKHTDGNIMPIIDQIAEAGPDALHSIDPQAGVDIAEIKRLYGKKMCLIGNVNCGLMDTGTEEQVRASASYALKHGMPGGGYIFSTSNCVYTGMELKKYEIILDVWKNEGNY